VPERGRQVGLADPDRSEDERAAALVEQPQRAQLVPGLPVEGGAAVAVEALQPHAGVELGGAGPQLGGGPVAPFDLVGQQQAEEVGVRQLLGAGQGEAFGQGVEQPAELDPAQQALELGIHRGAGAASAVGRLIAGLRCVRWRCVGCELGGVADEPGRSADDLAG
jgi:hypothetical protein